VTKHSYQYLVENRLLLMKIFSLFIQTSCLAYHGWKSTICVGAVESSLML